MRSLLKLARLIDRFTDWLMRSTTWIVVVTIGVGFYNVVMRYVGRLLNMTLSFNGLIELQWYLFSITFLLGFAYILKHGENVRVDFLYSTWSDRKKALLDFFGTILFLIPFCVLGILVTIDPVLTAWGLLPDGTVIPWEMSPDANGLPRAPIKTMVIIGFGLLLLQSIAQLIKYAAIFNGYSDVAAALKAESENISPE